MVSCLLVLALVCAVQGYSLQGIRVSGNKFVNGNNETVVLKGMDHSGTEYACVQGWGMFDGPHDSSLVNAFKAWRANAVRIPLNEDCWLGINGVKPQYAGQNYQNAIQEYVKMFTSEGIVAILDLHWTAPGGTKADKQVPMPDEDHSVAFWSSVAERFKNADMVFFEMFNEPYPDNGNWDSEAGWRCWRDGGRCNGFSFNSAGMQALVGAVRKTGANNVILIGGLAWSNSLKQWLQYKANDSMNNLAASWHSYNFNYCNNEGCWDSSVGEVKKQYPVVATEFGENDCAGGYVTPLMEWMDRQGISYLAWTFNAWDCKSGPALISDYNNGGTPTAYGWAVKNHLAK